MLLLVKSPGYYVSYFASLKRLDGPGEPPLRIKQTARAVSVRGSAHINQLAWDVQEKLSPRRVTVKSALSVPHSKHRFPAPSSRKDVLNQCLPYNGDCFVKALQVLQLCV